MASFSQRHCSTQRAGSAPLVRSTTRSAFATPRNASSFGVDRRVHRERRTGAYSPPSSSMRPPGPIHSENCASPSGHGSARKSSRHPLSSGGVRGTQERLAPSPRSQNASHRLGCTAIRRTKTVRRHVVLENEERRSAHRSAPRSSPHRFAVFPTNWSDDNFTSHFHLALCFGLTTRQTVLLFFARRLRRVYPLCRDKCHETITLGPNPLFLPSGSGSGG